MDTEWAIAQCREWIWLHERVPIEGTSGYPKSRQRGSKEERARISDRVRLIADAVYEGTSRTRFIHIDDVRTLMFELEEGLEVREKLGLVSAGPALAADRLHPWVWDAARPHWDSGNHDAAVWAAAINVNSHLKKKVERPDLGETKLVQEAFGLDAPKAGRVRLRLCDDSNPDLFRDRHLGALNLGHGLFSGVRNPLNHIGADDLTEQEALETLAAWSLFARWVDRAAVFRS
ncbi:MAG: hypothetical protein EOO27_30460 [Comamonadaceae bacterium]|nr:MAG: hypothetical protein EOO27_30460 [Comamonadaceae bacterium]